MIGLDLRKVRVAAQAVRADKAWYGRDVIAKRLSTRVVGGQIIASGSEQVLADSTFIALTSPDAVLAMITELRRRRDVLVDIAEGRHQDRCETGGRGDGPCKCAARMATELLDLTGDFGRLNEVTP